jgi:hypothetical protein
LSILKRDPKKTQLNQKHKKPEKKGKYMEKEKVYKKID